MAINTDIQAVFNSFSEQLKKVRDRVSPEEWNSMWNTIASQSNWNADLVNELKKFVVGNSKGIRALPDDYESLLDYVLDIASKIGDTENTIKNTESLIWTDEEEI